MRKKSLGLTLLATLLVIAGCKPVSTDSTPSNSTSTPDSTSGTSNSDSSSSSSTYVDPDGVINAHLVGDDHVKVISISSNNRPNSQNYFEFRVEVDDGYTLKSIVAVGDRTGSTYTIAGTEARYNVIFNDEDITITATSEAVASAEVPDAAAASIIAATGANTELTYTVTDLMPELGGGFSTTNNYSFGDSVTTKVISGSLKGSIVLVKNAEGNITIPSLGVDNKEVLDDKILNGDDPQAAWDSVYGDWFVANPISMLARDFDLNASNQITGYTKASADLIKQRFNFSTQTSDDSLVTHTLTLKPELLNTQYISGDYGFLYAFVQNDMALMGMVDRSSTDVITSLSFTLAADYTVNSMTMTYTGSTTYHSKSYASQVTVVVSNFAKVDSVADPYAPRTEESAKAMYSGKTGELLNELKKGNYTMTVQPQEQTTDGITGIGFDGVPNGMTGSDSPAKSGTIYATGDYVVSDQLAPLSKCYDDSGNYVEPTVGTYAADLTGTAPVIYGVTQDGKVQSNAYLKTVDLASQKALTKADFTPDLSGIDYHFFTAGENSTYTLSVNASDLLFGDLDAGILSAVFSPLDYLLGDSSTLFAAGDTSDNSNPFYATTGIDSLTFDFSKVGEADPTIDIVVDYAVTNHSSSDSKTTHSKILYTISNIGKTTESTLSAAAKKALAAVNAAKA